MRIDQTNRLVVFLREYLAGIESYSRLKFCLPGENAQNQLRQVVQKLCGEGGDLQWSGNAHDKMAVLRKAIKVLDNDKLYWRKLFSALKGRYQWVAQNDGALLKN